MMNISTLFFLVNSNEGSATDEARSMMMMDDDGDMAEWLVNQQVSLTQAPEAAVSKVLGFAHSYSVMPSKSLEYIDLYEN